MMDRNEGKQYLMISQTISTNKTWYTMNSKEIKARHYQQINQTVKLLTPVKFIAPYRKLLSIFPYGFALDHVNYNR